MALLLPHTTTDQELMHIRNSLPDGIIVQRVEEELSAFGELHRGERLCGADPSGPRQRHGGDARPGRSRWRSSGRPLREIFLWAATVSLPTGAGSCTPKTTVEDLDELSSLLQVPLVAEG